MTGTAVTKHNIGVGESMIYSSSDYGTNTITNVVLTESVLHDGMNVIYIEHYAVSYTPNTWYSNSFLGSYIGYSGGNTNYLYIDGLNGTDSNNASSTESSGRRRTITYQGLIVGYKEDLIGLTLYGNNDLSNSASVSSSTKKWWCDEIFHVYDIY